MAQALVTKWSRWGTETNLLSFAPPKLFSFFDTHLHKCLCCHLVFSGSSSCNSSVNIPGVFTACMLLATWDLVPVLYSSYLRNFTWLLQKFIYEIKNKELSLSLKEIKQILSGNPFWRFPHVSPALKSSSKLKIRKDVKISSSESYSKLFLD